MIKSVTVTRGLRDEDMCAIVVRVCVNSNRTMKTTDSTTSVRADKVLSQKQILWNFRSANTRVLERYLLKRSSR
jgi:hypothetical protein